MQKNEVSSILVVMVVLLMGIVCVGCITTTPPPALESTTSLNTSGACACECGTTAPTPTENATHAETESQDEYWIAIHPVGNVTIGQGLHISGSTTLPVGTEIFYQVLCAKAFHPGNREGKTYGESSGLLLVELGNGNYNTWNMNGPTFGFVQGEYFVSVCDLEGRYYTRADFYANEIAT